MVTSKQLVQALGITTAEADTWTPMLNDAMDLFEINTPVRAAAFLAQMAWESDKFRHLEENLNYGEAGLQQYFSHHFDSDEEIARYAHKPQAIANRVYANRHGNGNENSGDGWKYRGGGLPQLTFKDNYRAFGDAIGDDFVTNPDPVRTPKYAAMCGAWFWVSGAGLRLSIKALSHGVKAGCSLNSLADAGDFTGITLAINGGTNNLKERTALWEKFKEVLSC